MTQPDELDSNDSLQTRLLNSDSGDLLYCL